MLLAGVQQSSVTPSQAGTQSGPPVPMNVADARKNGVEQRLMSQIVNVQVLPETEATPTGVWSPSTGEIGPYGVSGTPANVMNPDTLRPGGLPPSTATVVTILQKQSVTRGQSPVPMVPEYEQPS